MDVLEAVLTSVLFVGGLIVCFGLGFIVGFRRGVLEAMQRVNEMMNMAKEGMKTLKNVLPSGGGGGFNLNNLIGAGAQALMGKVLGK